jgi:DNA mismatch repair protein MutS
MTNAKASSPSPQPSPAGGEGVIGHTPMMTQYMAVKAEHADCLLFYRMGDFYEMFFDDAVTASKILDLTLTRRGKAQGEDIPMCGVPFHASESYIARLIKAGQKVAICEQVETPQQAKERGGYKALVRREVIRVITPGTIIEDSLLNAKTNNYLVSCVEMNGVTGLAFADVSTGEFCLQSLNDKDIKSTLHRLSPSELIYPDIPNLAPEITTGGTPRPQGFFDSADGLLRIKTLFGLTEEDLLTKFSRAEIAAAGALLNYVDETQKGATPYLSSPRKADDFKAVDIDASTFRSLEIVKTQTGERSGSLIDLLDRAETGAGSRLLQSRLTSPIQDVMEINRRLDEIETCITNFDLTKKIKTTLKSVPDMERALARISLGRGGPRDLAVLRDGLYYAALIRSALIEKGLLETALSLVGHKLKLSDDIAKFKETLESALAESLPLLSRDGGFVASGYSPELDNLRALKSETQRHIANLQTKYVQDTGIETLKITHNNILGFFIEVPARRADAMMVKAGTNDNPFIHRQTLSTGVRFTTPDLSNLERDIALSAEKALALEENLFQEFSNTARTLAHEISMIAQGLAAIDVATAMADLAVDKGYKRPIIDNSTAFSIQRGRHPSVEYALQKNILNSFRMIVI